MSSNAHPVHYTYSEYLRLEHDSNIKHEYLDGQIFAMAGGTPDHAAMAANILVLLSVQLRGKRCRVYTSDLRVRVLLTGLATYPDATVVCGAEEHDPADANTLVNPIVLVEVLSKSSEEYDRGKKFEHYRRIPSLREYVLVSYQEPHVEVRRREEDGSWSVHEARNGGAVTLTSIGCELQVDEIYRDEISSS